MDLQDDCKIRTRHVGEALSLPKCTQLSRSLNGSSFPTQTVGAGGSAAGQ